MYLNTNALTDSRRLFHLDTGTLSTLLMTIDGTTPPVNTTFYVEEGEHIVLCIMTGVSREESQPDVQLFLGNQSQTFTGKSQEWDDDNATVRLLK